MLNIQWMAQTQYFFYQKHHWFQAKYHYQKREIRSRSFLLKETFHIRRRLQLRTHGVFQLKEVKRAVIKQNGKLIIVGMGDENPKYPAITNGVIQTDILKTINKTEDWLMDQLKQDGYENVDDIFIAEYDKGKLNVVTYSSIISCYLIMTPSHFQNTVANIWLPISEGIYLY